MCAACQGGVHLGLIFSSMFLLFHIGVQRVQGEFIFGPDLRWFPFDQQQLDIVLQSLQAPVREFAFVPDRCDCVCVCVCV
jgi:hypothetical protein